MTFPSGSQITTFGPLSSFDIYTTMGWGNANWKKTSNNLSPIPVLYLYTGTPFPVPSSIVTITKEQAMQRATYESNTWKFVSVWAIREGLEYPKLIKRGYDYIDGDPGQSIKWYVFVEVADDGTMYYNDVIYKSLKNGIKISMFEGETGEVVTHTWGGPKIPDNQGKVHMFLASGVQDPDYPGGYGYYTDETERTVTLREDRSINVNFYYIDAGLPSYNYLLRIAAPDGVAHLAIMKDNVSEIKVKMHDGSVCTVALVPLDDVQASPIRVMTTNGIFALKKIELFD